MLYLLFFSLFFLVFAVSKVFLTVIIVSSNILGCIIRYNVKNRFHKNFTRNNFKNQEVGMEREDQVEGKERERTVSERAVVAR